MTIDDVRKGFIDKREKFRKSKEFNNIMREVKSSKGDKTYRVSFKNNIWSCTCSGFTFRKKCTHTDSVKNDLKKLFIKNELPF
jgi:RNase P protein component